MGVRVAGFETVGRPGFAICASAAALGVSAEVFGVCWVKLAPASDSITVRFRMNVRIQRIEAR